MKIERVINGENVTIELTDEEVGKAYMEWQNMIDISDIKVYALDELGLDPDFFMEEFGLDIRLAEKYMDEILDAFSERRESYIHIDDDAKQEAVLDAIFEVLDDHKGEE